MPNWCISENYIHGPKTEIDTLYGKITEFTKHNAKENDFGLNWLGNIILNSGFQTTDEDNENGFECKGSIVEYEIISEDVLGLFIESAYEQMNKIWLALIEKYAPNCKLHFIAYEPNNNIYEKYEDLSDSVSYFDDIDYNLEMNIEDKNNINKSTLTFINNLEVRTGWSKKDLLQQANKFLLETGQAKIHENEVENFFKNFNDEIKFIKIGSAVLEKYKILNKEEI